MRSTQPRRNEETPWGPVQHVAPLIPGVAGIDTAGHGGYWCSPGRWAEVMTRFPDLNPFAGPGWLEEDCDWAYAALTWPQAFGDNEIHHALATALRYHAEETKAFLASEAGQLLIERAKDYRESIADQWERGGGIYGSGLDNTQFTRVGDRAELIAVKFRPDDHKGLYTLEEIEAASERVVMKEVAIAEAPEAS